MASYRLYFLHPDNRIQESVEFEYETDAEAERRAEHLMDHRAMELWSRARVVRKYQRLSLAS